MQVFISNQNPSNPIKTFMKMLLSTIAIAALIALPLRGMTAEAVKQSTNKMHKVVFEVAIDGAEKWEAALRNMANVQKSLGAKTTKIEVVAHGKGIGMLLATTAATNPEMKATVEKLHESGVVFAVCENTMKKMQITKDQLVPLATTVDSGVSEVIRKQEAGYAYIKSGG
jgi:intracellular sulfur oxidation DsrE/DsrF family protein